MAFIRAGELTVHYDLAGPPDAPVLVFANSLGTNFHIWDSQATGLAGRFRVLRSDDGAIDCPTLVMCGDRDEATPPDVVRGLADAIAGAAHIPRVERPEAITDLISGFLKENGIDRRPV